MGGRRLRIEKKPIKIANDIIKLLDIVCADNRYPVNVKEIALGYSKDRFPEHFIKDIKGDNLPNFEGALYGQRKDEKSRWVIFYNNQILEQRINFTLAHEFGHYMLHRDEKNSFECLPDDINRITDEAEREAEANSFASQLLMPPHDFREQIKKNEFSFDLVNHITNRYNVSLTAAILQWVKLTNNRAVMVVSKDEYIVWSYSSTSAYKDSLFVKTSGVRPVSIPEASYAFQRKITVGNNKADVKLPKGVWFKENVREFTIFSNQYDLTISLLVFEDKIPSFQSEAQELDTYEKMIF